MTLANGRVSCGHSRSRDGGALLIGGIAVQQFAACFSPTVDIVG